MGTQKIADLLRALSERGIERARPELAQKIKACIPSRLIPHPMDTINIIVDLRISRVAAAAIIVLAMLVIGRLLVGQGATARMYEDGKLLIRYTLGGEKAYQADSLGSLTQVRDELIAQGREVVYYGNQANLKDPCAVIMHWKVSEDKYGVILGDLTPRTVSAKTLITLQDHMLQSRSK
jgi:hypothetical protein